MMKWKRGMIRLALAHWRFPIWMFCDEELSGVMLTNQGSSLTNWSTRFGGRRCSRSELLATRSTPDQGNKTVPGLGELVDDDLESFGDLQLDTSGASCAASPVAATSTTKKRGQPKGSKNKPRKKQSSELLYEEIEGQQQEVVEASANSYNTRRARRSNYSQLDDPFSSE